MNIADRDVAASLLEMPADTFHNFVRRAVTERRLSTVVRVLNEQAVDKLDPNSTKARQALKRIGFTD